MKQLHIITQPFFLLLSDCVDNTPTPDLPMVATSIWLNFIVVGVGRLIRYDTKYKQYEVMP